MTVVTEKTADAAGAQPGDTSETDTATRTVASTTMDDLFPVYEASGDSESARPNLVMTPWMLLDCLKACQDDAYALLVEVSRSGLGEETRYGVVRNPLADNLEKINFGIAHILKVLWRGGLWADSELTEATATDGKKYLVMREPFTLGKPGSRPLPADAPDWQRELLGIPVVPEPDLTTSAPESESA